MRAPTTILLAALLAVPAVADQSTARGKDTEAGYEPGSSVEMPFLIAPMNKDGKLIGYAYISSKVIASSAIAAVRVREKTPFLQDAFVRDVNAAPIAKADAPLMVDQPALVARLLGDAKRIAGSKQAVRFVITQIQVAPSHPKGS